MFKNAFFTILTYGIAVIALAIAIVSYITFRQISYNQPEVIIKTVVITPVVEPTASVSASVTPVKRSSVSARPVTKTP